MEIVEKIGYTRVSTRDQEPENQVRLLQAEGIAPDFIFVDKGISGTVPAEKRPGFQRAMAYIKDHPGEVKYLYVFELSRLGRNFLETANLMESLEKSGIVVWSISPAEGFMRIPDKSIRELLTSIMLWVAQRERANLIERTKAGMDRAEAEGKIIGRPRVQIDFEYVSQKRIEGLSWVNIADELKIPVMTLFRARKRRGMV
jgi:DNA invertase Pin-like site-specific DNA recombinase